MPYSMRCVFIFARHTLRYEKKDCHVKNTAEGVGRESRGLKMDEYGWEWMSDCSTARAQQKKGLTELFAVSEYRHGVA